MAFIEGWFAAHDGRLITVHGLTDEAVQTGTERFFALHEVDGTELAIGFDDEDGRTWARTFSSDGVTATVRDGSLHMTSGDEALVFTPTKEDRT